jgi:hypothetical protein
MTTKLKLVPTAIAALLAIAGGVSAANAATRLQPHEEFPDLNLNTPVVLEAGVRGQAEASASKGVTRRAAASSDHRAQIGSVGDLAPAIRGTAATPKAGVSDDAASFDAIRRALVAY